VSNIGPNRAQHFEDKTGEHQLSQGQSEPHDPFRTGLSFAFRLGHSVKDRVYWTKVSINTFASDGHVDAYAF